MNKIEDTLVPRKAVAMRTNYVVATINKAVLLQLTRDKLLQELVEKAYFKKLVSVSNGVSESTESYEIANLEIFEKSQNK